MTQGTMDLAALAETLGDHDGSAASVYALLRRADTGWTVHHLWGLVGLTPPQWTEQRWRYADVALVACAVPRASLAVVCSENQTNSITLGALEVEVPAAQGPASWRREPSFARLDQIPLPHPTTNYTIAAAKRDTSSPSDTMLVGAGCPSFPELKSAWLAFTDGDFGFAGPQALPQDLAVIRIAESRSWIGPVHITATQASAEVHGDAVAGCELELYGATNRDSRVLDGPGRVVFPLVDGLPQHAWLWLKHDTTWLDYRSLDPHSGYTGELARAGVDIDIPIEPQANLEALLTAGEGPRVEFKEQLVRGRQLKTIAAFANGNGGTLVFGINRDETTITGLDGDPRQLRDQIGQRIRAAIIPTPEFTVSDHVCRARRSCSSRYPPATPRPTESSPTPTPATDPSTTSVEEPAPTPHNPATSAKRSCRHHEPIKHLCQQPVSGVEMFRAHRGGVAGGEGAARDASAGPVHRHALERRCGALQGADRGSPWLG